LSKKSLRWTKKRAIEVMQGIASQHLIREVWAGNLQRDTWTVMRKMLENTNWYGFCCQVRFLYSGEVECQPTFPWM